jgi:hypothetical protein
MNRKLRLGTLTTAMLFVTAALYLGPRTARAEFVCYCDGTDPSERFYTECWGKGATPEEATSNLHGDCAARARDFCITFAGANAACQVTSTLTAPAWWNADVGMYQTDGYAYFGCWYCRYERDPILPEQ